MKIAILSDMTPCSLVDVTNISKELVVSIFTVDERKENPHFPFGFISRKALGWENLETNPEDEYYWSLTLATYLDP
jgi:hypothetical protein